MEKRQLYIITTLIILSLLTGLAIWYAYIVRKQEQLTQTKTIEIKELTTPPPNINLNNNLDTASDSTQAFGGQFGNNIKDPAQQNTTNQNDNIVTKPDIWTLSNITQEPVLNFSIKDSIIIYMEAKTGIINNYDIENNQIDTISQDIIPDLRDFYTLPKDNILIIPKNERPYISNLKEDKKTIIYDNILQIAQTKDALYYLSPIQEGITVKKIKYKDLNKKELPITAIWDSPLTNWILQSNNTDIYIYQKASNNIPGYAYRLSDSGKLTRLMADKPALLVNLSPNKQALLYSTVQDSTVSLNLKNIINGEVTPLYIKTLASKCVWNTDSIIIYCAVPNNLAFIENLPDSWYKGLSHLSDNLWGINTKTGEAIELLPYTGLDIIDIKVIRNGIVFKDKISQTLWSIIKEKQINKEDEE